MKLTQKCPKCHKTAKIQAEFSMGASFITYVYTCGHSELKLKINTQDSNTKDVAESNGNGFKLKESELNLKALNLNYEDEIKAWDYEGGSIPELHETYIKNLPPFIPSSFYGTDNKKRAYDFQIDGIKFAESTQLNCLIADAMGLGKTIQALIALKRNAIISLPALIIVKGTTLFQWAHEFSEWVNKDFGKCIPVTSRLHLIPGYEVYVLSMDMLSKQDIQDKLLTLNLKTVVIDEVQNFKDPSAKRTKGLINLIKLANIKYKIALSGTPIKNKVSEYFTILNILAPSHFYDLSAFKFRWLVPNEKGIYTRLNPLKAEAFKELTSQWIIRRERHEVLKNLPPLTRDYQIIEIDDINIRNSYNRTLDLFKNYLDDQKNSRSGINSTEILGWLAKLRAITGQAKCKPALEWIIDFLESSDESLAIGIQHHSVRDTLYYVLEAKNLNPLKLSGEDSVYRKADIVREFTRGNARVLVINSLAGGVGLNLQTCAQALVLERQWNSADEEQFEGRFHRDGQKQAVIITYMIAKGTIDEFFHELVNKKRNILAETGIGAVFDLNNDIDSLLEFSNTIVNHKI